VVDKRLGVVFGITSGSHQLLSVPLYRYHNAAIHPDGGDVHTNLAARLYLEEGMGWFISSMNAGHIVSGSGYRPDRFDRNVFLFYDGDHNR